MLPKLILLPHILLFVIFTVAASLVTISGNTSMVPDAEEEYICTAGEANPEATLSWIVKDDGGVDVPYRVIDNPEDDAKVAAISLQATKAHDKIHITCMADNKLGQSNQTILVNIESKNNVIKSIQ